MTPYKKKDILPQVAEETGLALEEVGEVVNFYWETVSTSVRELRHFNIHIPGLGDMRFAKSKLDGILERTQVMMEECTPGTSRYEQLRLRKERMEQLRVLRDKEYAHKSAVTQRKHEHKQAKENLGPQMGDSGGPVV